VRAAGDPSALAGAVRAAVAEVDPELPVMVIRRGTDLMSAQLAMPRFLGVLLGAFAAVALLLALVGIYGVMSFLVAQRDREMGVRLALGARPREVLGLVLREAAGLTGIGVVVGLVVAMALARGLASQLFGVRPADPATLAAAALLVVAAALGATAFPAARAARLDPGKTLREE
jgi:ABC-type antimicrobial peptide transport system permease subunit